MSRLGHLIRLCRCATQHAGQRISVAFSLVVVTCLGWYTFILPSLPSSPLRPVWHWYNNLHANLNHDLLASCIRIHMLFLHPTYPSPIENLYNLTSIYKLVLYASHSYTQIVRIFSYLLITVSSSLPCNNYRSDTMKCYNPFSYWCIICVSLCWV